MGDPPRQRMKFGFRLVYPINDETVGNFDDIRDVPVWAQIARCTHQCTCYAYDLQELLDHWQTRRLGGHTPVYTDPYTGAEFDDDFKNEAIWRLAIEHVQGMRVDVPAHLRTEPHMRRLLPAAFLHLFGARTRSQTALQTAAANGTYDQLWAALGPVDNGDAPDHNLVIILE